ncbi:MAG TPA: DUF4105 domain-containing protein, partial [Dongiaceae bacterium]|nr:DUF4105 domain-containing protein [Dongiaceae bacterium]
SAAEGAPYHMEPDLAHLLIANVRHAGRWWLAEVPVDAVSDVVLMIEYFPAAVPAAHTQLRFRFGGEGVRLVPQVGRADTIVAPLTDLVYSVEAVSPVGGEGFDLVKGMRGHYATAYRFVSLDDRYHQMVTVDHHRVEQVRLALDPDQRRRVLVRAIRDSDAARLDRMYHTLALNCTTELLRAVDRAVPFDRWHRTLATLTGFLDGIPTQCRTAFAVRGLAPRGHARMPDLEREWGPARAAAH